MKPTLSMLTHDFVKCSVQGKVRSFFLTRGYLTSELCIKIFKAAFYIFNLNISPTSLTFLQPLFLLWHLGLALLCGTKALVLHSAGFGIIHLYMLGYGSWLALDWLCLSQYRCGSSATCSLFVSLVCLV